LLPRVDSPVQYLSGGFVYLPEAEKKPRCRLHRATSTSSDAVNSVGDLLAIACIRAAANDNARDYSSCRKRLTAAASHFSPEGFNSCWFPQDGLLHRRGEIGGVDYQRPAFPAPG
jgi:hypothetical protein